MQLVKQTLATATLAILATTTLTGCLAHRPVQPPAEPDWSYQDDEPQLSNDDAWASWEATASTATDQQTVLGSVERPLR